MVKKQIREANVLRAIACLSVAMVHISAIPLTTLLRDSIHMKLFILLNRSVKFTTPTFIFLSGLTLFYGYKDKRFSYCSFLKKRLSTTLIPYMIWTLIYYRYYIHEKYYVFSWEFLREKLLLADMTYHLYFILTILQFYLLFWVFLYIFKNFKPGLVLIILCMISLLAVKYVKFPYADRFFARYVFFFGLGCYAAIDIDAIREKLIRHRYFIGAAHAVSTCYYAYQFYEYHVLQKSIDNFVMEITWSVFCFTAIMFYFVIAYYVGEKEDGFLYKSAKKISKASFYIYLSHPLVIFLSEKMMTEAGLLSITRRFILTTMIVYGSVVPLAIIYNAGKRSFKQYNRDRKAKKVTLQRGV
ncbi:hypothetical protein BJL90_02000 [Clostridium formicaceticum]|uniref:Acyltransferase 3 domain-containing protein n=1 Tax=Clostridium formicaceticum TaxID=1497 RepID=A0ABM6EPK2_9CLOT|nr:hypothetical protein BJL90_02000 [Clostridium formicaceticum]